MDQIREDATDSVPNPRQVKRAPTANRNDTLTHKHHRRIVSEGNKEPGIGLAGGNWTTLSGSFEDGEIISAGTFAMGFTNRVPPLNSMQTTAQPTHGTKIRMVCAVVGSQ
jgi:hypothetical protein